MKETLLYNDNEIAVYVYLDEYTIINKNTAEISTRILDWWVNDDETYLQFLELILKEINAHYTQETLETISNAYRKEFM